jgi:hypothetical protein
MAQRNSGYERIPDEAYDTIGWPVGGLVMTVGARKLGLAWDCCDRGHGVLVSALRALGGPTIGTEKDFLSLTAAPPDVDSLVTNPPYGEKKKGETAVAFIEHALNLSVPFVAMLLRADFDSVITRQHLFRFCPSFSFKLVLLGRIKWFEGPSEPSDNHSWFCWDRAHSSPPRVHYVTKSEAIDDGRMPCATARI